MAITGIICEYNPLHLGHQKQLDIIRSGDPDGGIVCIMSGNFVQRGKPAIFDKMRRAEAALNRGDYERCGALLEAAEIRDEGWNFLRGRVYLAREDYENALRCFRTAEEAHRDAIYPMMEQCARELEDYKLAYEYACKQK